MQREGVRGKLNVENDKKENVYEMRLMDKSQLTIYLKYMILRR